METKNMTTEEQIAALKAENEKLRAKANPPITVKVSAKGAVSVYGLGRFPVTLYGEQWNRVLDKSEEIRSFIKANATKLATKA